MLSSAEAVLPEFLFTFGAIVHRDTSFEIHNSANILTVCFLNVKGKGNLSKQEKKALQFCEL